ncbi:endolytic transglycosylase MltG [Halocynthiibacter styelae]|uniref:Endolytic murein transglycosylase n=1 Tax=Halocynthiibacter styelae TaxID=2761955 RepID=A0A8J7IWG2_9RHOB|nr:endolytic transglycosylase MltG [Paenihalocynthiibacter styelae]MBI1494088.1 endolytic transglycosylase MltG [Paenihalocynthiibacter styelae]
MFARHIAANALTLIGVLSFAGVAVVAWGKKQYEAPGPLAQAICLRVEGGADMKDVADTLEAQRAVSTRAIFAAGAQYSGRAHLLKAGSFLVPAGASMQDINEIVTGSGRSTCGTEINYRIGILRAKVEVNELDPETSRYVEVVSFNPAEDDVPAAYTEMRDDPSVRYRITMAQGITSWQIVEALNNADFLSGEIAEVPAEGTLAPLGEDVRVGMDRNELIAQMVADQERVLAEAWEARAEGLPYANAQEALIMASIIEKETGVGSERPMVASVFVNRLNQGIRLQTDPTVIYGITQGKGSLGRGIRQSELRRETPWNTYVIDGLPPTPIANPGKAAIEAALNPDDTDFIFFVADGTGGHAFARTLQEHNANVAKWREIEAQRAEEAAAAGN